MTYKYNPEKKAAFFWTLSKRGGEGPTQIQRFWVSFWGLLLDIMEERGRGAGFPKGLG